VVICLEHGADLHMAQLMLLPLTVSCFSKIQIGFTFLVPAHLGSPGKGAVKPVCVCVCGSLFYMCCFKQSYVSHQLLLKLSVVNEDITPMLYRYTVFVSGTKKNFRVQKEYWS